MNHEAINSTEHEIINQRLELLFDCLWHCSRLQEVGRGYIFSPGQRILINQERGALMSQQTARLYKEEEEVRYYTIPAEIETKIQFIKSKL